VKFFEDCAWDSSRKGPTLNLQSTLQSAVGGGRRSTIWRGGAVRLLFITRALLRLLTSTGLPAGSLLPSSLSGENSGEGSFLSEIKKGREWFESF